MSEDSLKLVLQKKTRESDDRHSIEERSDERDSVRDKPLIDKLRDSIGNA